MTTDQAARAGLRRELTTTIDAIAPYALTGMSLQAPGVQMLIALLVACRAEFGGTPSERVIDLSRREYSVGGAS